MLRRLIVLATILLTSVVANSQIIIDYDDFAKEGDGFIYGVKNYKTGELNVSQIDYRNWNLTDLTPDDFDTVRFYNKKRTRYGKFFENCETVKFKGRRSMEYWQTDTAGVSCSGLIDDYLGLNASVVLIFPRNLQLYNFPLKKGNYLKDSISKKFLSSYGLTQFADSVRIDLDMTNISYFDTIGTVKTPTDTYQTLREKNTVYKNITAYINDKIWGWRPAPHLSRKITTVYYRWFAKNGGIPIVEIEADNNGVVNKIRYQYRQPMIINIEKKDATCKGAKNGEIKVIVEGGVPDYKYVWDNGAKGKLLENLTAGKYTITVTDSKGTTKSQTVEITEPDYELNLDVSIKNITCYGSHDGKLTAKISGGTEPYYIVWSNDVEAMEINNLGSGDYGVIVRDAKRCFVWDTVTIEQASEPMTFFPTAEPAPCKGKNGGKIDFNVKGGAMPYKLTINDTPSQEIAENLIAGHYQLKAEDKYGCVAERSIEVREPDKELQAIGEVTNVSCKGGNNGAIILKVLGGTPSYTFEWSNDQTSQNINSLPQGNYEVKIYDSKKCTLEKNFVVSAPTEILTLNYVKTDVKCRNASNGKITVSASGGTPPYNYMWSNHIKTPVAENLKAGDYTVKITDQKNCLVTETIEILQPETAPEISAETQNNVCHDGKTAKISSEITGGRKPYSFSWSNGQTTKEIDGISDGTYKLIVTDADGCTDQKSFNITSPDKPLDANITVENLKCYDGNDGSFRIQAVGGVPGYEYLLNDGSSNPIQKGMVAGIYSVRITDKAGCEFTKNFEIKQPDKITADIKTKQPSPNKPDGSAEIKPIGGEQPYKIRWNDGFAEFKRTKMPEGIYNITIIDKNNCQTEQEFTLGNE